MVNQYIQNYKVLSKIAEGGMGKIFYGEHKTLNRPVAIKQLHSNFTDNPDFKDRFINEAMILAQLNHTNIITIYDLIEEAGIYYIIMEYVQGDALDDIMQKYNSPFQTQRAVYIFKQVLSAFEYAHNKGIIHRDIKPSNIMLEEGDKPKILDFGIAKLVRSNLNLTKAGTRMGSVYYMSPEQVMGQNVDIRSDIYSLGILLYEMLTRSLPYNIQTDSEYSIMESIMKVDVPNLSLFRSDIDFNLSSSILRACSKDINLRFNSCKEFLEALNDASYSYVPPVSQNTVISNNFNSTVYSQPVYNHPAYTQPVKPSKDYKNMIYILLTVVMLLITASIIVIINKDNGTVDKGQDPPPPPPPPPPTKSISAPLQVVRGFIEDLGKGDFESAYSRQNNKAWGTYKHFSSTKAFGGISSATINDIKVNSEDSFDASVYVDYTAYDPYNKNGTYKQNFMLKKLNSDWKIVKVYNIEINTW